MVRKFLALARTPGFIPLVYNYCDMWCERCPITGRCLLFASEQLHAPIGAGGDRMRDRLKRSLELTQAMIAAANPASAAIADLTRRDVSTTQRPTAIGHPLEFLARHYAIQTHTFLNSLDRPEAERLPSDSPLGTIAWYHTLIAAKTFRALTSDQEARTDAPELMSDAVGSAKVVLVAIERSLAALQALAAGDQDARIGGLIDLLEALRIGVELRFPDARAFIRPGLDDGGGEG
jgi:hypothetical protein